MQVSPKRGESIGESNQCFLTSISQDSAGVKVRSRRTTLTHVFEIGHYDIAHVSVSSGVNASGHAWAEFWAHGRT